MRWYALCVVVSVLLSAPALAGPATPSTEAASATPLARVGLFGYPDFCDCVLHQIQGVRNDIAASFVVLSCNNEKKCKSRKDSWFAMTFEQCIVKYGRDVQGELATNLVAVACAASY